MADQDTNWTWNFSGPTTESKAQSRAILPREIAWELTGVDGNEVGGLRTHPGFKAISTFALPVTSHTLVNVFPITALIDASNFVYGHIFFTTLSTTTFAYLQLTSNGVDWYTSASSIATWTGSANEITVKCMGKFTYIFVRGQDPKTLQITNANITTTNFSLWTGGPGTAPVVKVISVAGDDKAADYADTPAKDPAGSRTGGSPTYPQEMHVYRAGSARSAAVTAFGSGAVATCTVNAGVIDTVTIVDRGYDYIKDPIVSITPTSGGAGGVIVATTKWFDPGFGGQNPGNTLFKIDTLTITNGGSGYTTAPTLSFNSGGSSNLTSPVGTPIKLKSGSYSFAVQYMSTATGRKSVISNVQTVIIGLVPSGTTSAASTEEYIRLKVRGFGISGEYNKALIYRTVKDAGEGGALHLEKILNVTYNAVTLYDVEIPDNQLVYLDVYIDKGIMDKTMPMGGVAGFMGSTLFVSRISGTDTAEPAGITPLSPPRSAGDMRWSSTGEIQPENFKPSNRWIPQTPGNEILGMQTVGNYMMAFSGDRVYRIGRAGQFIKVEEVHMGYGLAGVDALEGVGGMVYFVSGGGMKAISADGQIEDVAGLDALINRLWLGQKSELKMAYDAVGQCLTIIKPPTALGVADGAAVCMWFGTNRITELADLPFHYVRSGAHIVGGKLQRRSVFYKRNSTTSWGAYIVDHERLRGTGKNLCGETARFATTGAPATAPSPTTVSEFDCAMYNIVTGQRSSIVDDSFVDDNQTWSISPILFRWVGGNVGVVSQTGQPEYKDFFTDKQLSTCQPYFEVVSLGTLPGTNATWRSLAYRGTEETTISIGVPTNRTGQVPNTFSTSNTSPEALNAAAFGKHGIVWSSLSVGFQCDIVGVDLRLLAFSTTGKVLDTTRRYV